MKVGPLKICVFLFSLLEILPSLASSSEPVLSRELVQQLASMVPARPIRRVSIVPVDQAAAGGDVLIEYADGRTHRLSTGARAQAAQVAPDGQAFGFAVVSHDVDPKGDVSIATRAIVLYRQGKRVAVIETQKQARVGWAFRWGSSAIVMSTPGTHGTTPLSLWDVATGTKMAEVTGREDTKYSWTQGAPLLFCCTMKPVVNSDAR